MNTVEKIQKLINEINISAYTLTQSLGLSNSAISDWKAGRAKPSADALLKIADYFDVSVDYLLGRTDEQQKKPMLEHMSFSEFSKVLLENGITENKVNNLSDEQMKLIALTIKNFNNDK